MRGGLVLGGVVATMVLAASAAQAASFDCAKAKSRSEVMICADPELSRFDEQLMAAYRAELAMTPAPVGVTMEQRAWVRDRDLGGANNQGKMEPLTAEEMKHRYGERIKELGEERALALKAQASFPLADLGRRCVPLFMDHCKVESSGGIKGPASLGPLWFQLQSPADDAPEDEKFRRGSVVFVSAGPGMLRPLLWNFNDGSYFQEPQLFHTADGWVLSLPGSEDGTGVFNMDMLYHQVAGRWRDIDITTWKDDLAKRLPKSRQVWKGVPYDFAKLETTTGLWKPDDGNCCPTAGQAHVKFHITGDRMVITSVGLTDKNVE
jgi:uncharacterized protein